MKGTRRQRVWVALGGAVVAIAATAVVVSRTSAEPPASTLATIGPAQDRPTSTTADPSITSTTDRSTTTSLPEATTTSEARRSVAATAPTSTPTSTTAAAVPVSAPPTCDEAGPAPPEGVDVVALATGDGLRERSIDGTIDYVVPGTSGVDLRWSAAAWDRSQRHVAYPRRATAGSASSIVVADLAARCWQAVTPDDGATREVPVWTHDGRVAYRRWRPGPGFDPKAGGIDATSLTTLETRTVLRGVSQEPAWAPDGSGRVAFSDDKGLELLDERTGKVRLLHAADSTEFPAWSPDLRSLVFSISVNARAWLVPVDGSAPAANVAPPDLWIYWSSWSPDGRQLAFVGGGGPSMGGTPPAPNVWVVGADGSDPRRLTDHGRPIGKVHWSPDGRTLAYAVTRAGTAGGGTTDVEVVGLDGGEPRTIARDAQPVGFFRRP